METLKSPHPSAPASAPEDLPVKKKRGPGRPRHQDAEGRAFAAVLEIFAQRGWAGLSLDAVSNEAALGKSSIYLRWSDKHDLLMQAFDTVDFCVVDRARVGELSATELLIEAATRRVNQYLGAHGLAVHRLSIERRVYPEIFQSLWVEKFEASLDELTVALADALGVDVDADRSGIERLVWEVEGAALYHTFVRDSTFATDARELGPVIADIVDRALEVAQVELRA